MFYLGQAGGSLQSVSTAGTVAALTLPSGVTISTTLTGHWAILNQQIVFVTAGTVSLWIDPRDLTVRPLHILPPTAAPAIAAGSGTGLTGAYRVGVAYGVRNVDGILLNRSPVTGPSIAATLTNKDASITNIPISPDPLVTCRIVYRTAAGGTDLFESVIIDDNVTTAILDTLPDAALGDQPADLNLSIAPGAIPGTALALITEWKSRLWAVSAAVGERDDVLFTEVDTFYGFSADNSLPAYPKGADQFGVTGFARRRDALGVLKRDRVLKIIGSSPDDFEVIILAERIGCVAPESVVVIRDTAYWLGLDGVYRWDDAGVVCISRATVDPWFTTDFVFNRGRFQNAFAEWNPVLNTYDLHLAALGSSVEDRWISFHLDLEEWLGPHQTAAFTPTCAALLEASTDVQLPVLGAADDYVYLLNQDASSDISGGAVTSAIDAFFEPRWHHNKAPDITHFWGRLSVLSRFQSAGQTLTITPYVGRLDAVAGTPFTHDLTKGREIFQNLGVGPLCRVRFEQHTAGWGFVVYGYEIKPTFEVGLR